MNVIKVPRPPQRKKRAKVQTEGIKRLRTAATEFTWHGLVEILLFGTMALVSFWPVLAAMDAVARLK